MTISAPQIGSADMSVSLIKVSANLPARSGHGRDGGRHPRELCWGGPQKLVNKIIGLPRHAWRKLLIKDEISRDLMAKPGHLSLGIAAGGALSQCDRLVERDFAAQMAQQLGHSDAFHRGQVGWKGAGHQRRRLLER